MEKLRIVLWEHPNGDIRYNTKNHEVVGVITAAEPTGRGQKLKSAVKEYALANNLPLPNINLKDEDFLSELKSLNANLQVVAFRMLPKVVWEMPSLELSTFTLPPYNYRGAAPIN
jgi:methionyl-tRNA formyltransferase